MSAERSECSLWLPAVVPALLLLLSCFSHVRLYVTPWTAAHQAPPSLGFSRQEDVSNASPGGHFSQSLDEPLRVFRLRSQGPCRLGTGESGLVLG